MGFSWNSLFEKMEKMGYNNDRSSVLQNVEEEDKELFLYGHRDRLATFFALLNTGRLSQTGWGKSTQVGKGVLGEGSKGSATSCDAGLKLWAGRHWWELGKEMEFAEGKIFGEQELH
ncbi:Pentatricopeptide repeat-containing protein [Camellia lanceoleosa]|uniref:Pentatricopeptide repeat-containing protein n=1 Tax=Camellia lanceoleosa TaxID=1840588 RepID=A0ACC0IVJ7_9ERIC|nr:Pentatricopeptide repeat-containing protein [Camellia lanceoleosa]